MLAKDLDWMQVQTVAFGLIVMVLLVTCVLLLRNRKRDRSLAERQHSTHLREVDHLVHEHELRLIDALKRGEERERQRSDEDLKERLNSIIEGIQGGFAHLEQRIEDIDARHEEQCRQVITQLDQAMHDMRRAGRASVRSLLEHFGLGSVLDDLRWSLEASGTVQVALATRGIHPGMDRNAQLQLYHLVHDAVDGAMGFADVDRLDIELSHGEGGTVLTVTDNGSNWRPDRHLAEMGRRRLDARVRRGHGSIHQSDVPGGGHTLRIEFPVG